VILWNNVFGANQKQNVSLLRILTDAHNEYVGDRFFDLDVLCSIFPNLEQIEYFAESCSQHFIQKLVRYIMQTQASEQLKYVIIHHTLSKMSSAGAMQPKSSSRLMSLESVVSYQSVSAEVARWDVLYAAKKVIVHRQSETDPEAELADLHDIKFHFNAVKQGGTTLSMLSNLGMDILADI